MVDVTGTPKPCRAKIYYEDRITLNKGFPAGVLAANLTAAPYSAGPRQDGEYTAPHWEPEADWGNQYKFQVPTYRWTDDLRERSDDTSISTSDIVGHWGTGTPCANLNEYSHDNGRNSDLWEPAEHRWRIR